jgi:hypothetical protein
LVRLSAFWSANDPVAAGQIDQRNLK